MNILFVACSSHLYGANQSLLNILTMCRSYYNCFVVLPNNGPLSDVIREKGVSCKIIKYKSNCANYSNKIGYILRLFYYWILNKLAKKSLIQYAKNNKINIIHTNNTRVSIGFDVAVTLGIKHVWHLRDFMDLDFNMKPFKSVGGLSKDFNKSDKVICVSNAVKEYFKILDEKAVVIYNAVGSKNEYNSNGNCFKENYFLFCGSLSKEKGIFDVLEAFYLMKKDSSLCLYIAGTGKPEIIKEIKKIIKRNKIEDKVFLLGFRSDTDILMKNAVALLMASKCEAFGRVTAEAMLNECVVIGRNSGGTPELIEHGKTGFLFSSKEELINIMETVLQINTSDIISKAKSKALHSFTEEVYIKKLLSVYESLL